MMSIKKSNCNCNKMNKLISELSSAGLSELLLSDILSKYEISEIGVKSKDMIESMVCKALSVEGRDEELKCSLKLSKSKSVSKKVLKSVSKSVEAKAEEEHLNNLCLDAFNENSVANGVTPIVVEKKVKMSAEEKAFEKALAIAEKAKAKEEAKVQALKAKEEAKKAKEDEKAKAAEAKAQKAQEKADKAAELKAQKAQEKLKAKEEAKAAKDAEKLKAKEALKEEKLKAKEALKNEKKESKQAEKKEKKVSEKKEKKSEKVVAVVEADEVEEEPDVVKRFEFEGVKYLKSKNTGIIYNMEQDVIGKWNEATQKIDFNKEEGEEEEEEYDN